MQFSFIVGYFNSKQFSSSLLYYSQNFFFYFKPTFFKIRFLNHFFFFFLLNLSLINNLFACWFSFFAFAFLKAQLFLVYFPPIGFLHSISPLASQAAICWPSISLYSFFGPGFFHLVSASNILIAQLDTGGHVRSSARQVQALKPKGA